MSYLKVFLSWKLSGLLSIGARVLVLWINHVLPVTTICRNLKHGPENIKDSDGDGIPDHLDDDDDNDGIPDHLDDDDDNDGIPDALELDTDGERSGF